ncbi:MAG: sensor domain-containing diguanylate cyclase [Acidimicrobiales bacterium]
MNGDEVVIADPLARAYAIGEQAGAPHAPGLLEKLTPYLTQSIVVVDKEATIIDALGPPGGILGATLIGAKVFDFSHPDDLAQCLEFTVSVLGTEPGWEGTWTTRLRQASGEWGTYDMLIVNRTDDPVIRGFVIRVEEAEPLQAGEPDVSRFPHELELEPLASTVNVPIVLFGAHRLAYYSNEAARELCGAHLPILEEGGLAALARPAERAYVHDAFERRFDAPGSTTITFHLDPAGDDNDAPIIEAHLSARGRHRVYAIVATLHDVSERHQTEAALRKLARVDSLTELPNRRALLELLEQRLALDASHLGILFIDLDGFKAVNDTYGHDVGDEVLIHIGRSLRAQMRPEDVVGRIGGDEFVAIVHHVAIDRLVELGNRIISAIMSVGEQRAMPLSASLGMAVGKNGDSPKDLLNRADRAMYEDKRAREFSLYGQTVDT